MTVSRVQSNNTLPQDTISMRRPTLQTRSKKPKTHTQEKAELSPKTPQESSLRQVKPMGMLGWALKASEQLAYASGRHHIWWQCIPQVNRTLSKDVFSLLPVLDLPPSNWLRWPVGLVFWERGKHSPNPLFGGGFPFSLGLTSCSRSGGWWRWSKPEIKHSPFPYE